MIKALLVALFICSGAFGQTLEEFNQYDEAYIWSNMYLAVNERCHALILTEGDATNAETYIVNPLPEVYEIPYTTNFYFKPVSETNYPYRITNTYISFPLEYPTIQSNSVWGSAPGAEYGYDRPIFFTNTIPTQRYVWEIVEKQTDSNGIPTNAIFISIDLGVEISSKVAQLVATEKFVKFNPSLIDAFNETNGDVYEWNDSKVRVQYYWPGTKPNGECESCDFPLGEWKDEPPPPDWPCIVDASIPRESPINDECFGLRITPDPSNSIWQIRGSNYVDKFPIKTTTNFIENGLFGTVITNQYTFLFQSNLSYLTEGWTVNQFDKQYVTNTISSTNYYLPFVSMTNYVYEYPHLLDYKRRTYLESAVPSSWITFSLGKEEFSKKTNTITINGQQRQEVVTYKTNYVTINYLNNESVNAVPDPHAYHLDEVQNKIKAYRISDTNNYYNDISTYDLPNFLAEKRVFQASALYYPSNFLASSNYPLYEIVISTNEMTELLNTTATKFSLEEFESAYYFNIRSDTNSTSQFIYTNDIYQYQITETLYSIQTNNNQYYDRFPIHDQFIFVNDTMPYRVSPDYYGAGVSIDRHWLWQKWLQLKKMQASRITATKPHSTETNTIKEISRLIRTSPKIDITNITYTTLTEYPLNEPLDLTVKGIRTYSESAAAAGQSPTILNDYNYTEKYGYIGVLKSTNLTGSINVLMADRYAQPRWGYFNRDDNLYVYEKYKPAECTYLIKTDSDGNQRVIIGYGFPYSFELKQNGDEWVVNESAYLFSTTQSTSSFVDVEFYVPPPKELTLNYIDDRICHPAKQLDCGETTFELPEVCFGSKRAQYAVFNKTLVELIWEWDFKYILPD